MLDFHLFWFFLRLSRDEKLYQKELEAALEASMKDTQPSPENDSSSNTNDNEQQELSDEEEIISSKPKKPRLLPSSDTEDNNKENSG